METIQVGFFTKPVLTMNTHTLVTAPIPRNGDLVKDIFLVFTLPDIYSTDKYRFQWIPKIGNYIMNSYSLIIGGQRIDRRYGEWLDIWNELTLPADKTDAYNRMIGHVPELYQPRSPEPIYDVSNNTMTFLYYPVGAEGKPSINRRKIYVPLQFFFTRNPALAIPLIALQYHEVTVEIDFVSLRDLYQVYDQDTGTYVSPVEYTARHPGDYAGIGRFLTNDQFFFEAEAVDLDAYLEVNYIFLDNAERKALALQPQDYLIEQVFRFERDGITAASTFDLIVNYPVKEFIWTTRRSDMRRMNNWVNLTNDIYQNENAPILKSAKFLFNGVDRIEEKDAEYFHLLQPYMHHTRSPRQGIYTYSFALYPERGVQPSGFVNFSTISRLQMQVSMQPRLGDYEYSITLYSLSFNIFRVMGGMGGLVFNV